MKTQILQVIPIKSVKLETNGVEKNKREKHGQT